VIHVLFSSSAAGTLRQLLRSRDIREKVVDLTEWLDTGWISSDCIEDRINWFQERPPWKNNWDWAADCGHRFLEAVNADDARLIWLAPRSAQEQSGFFWYLHQTRMPPSRMIIADYPLRNAWRGEPPLSLGELAQDSMAQLLGECPRVAWDAVRFPIERWRTLMDDGAVLRVIENGELKSARADHYDDAILRWCPAQWTKWIRVIGDTMGHAGQDGYVIDDLFLRWRLQELISAGPIECEGELPPWDIPSTYAPAMVRRRPSPD
jgi:Protein of unknown function/Domain of unknown function (DUF1835)